MNLQCLEIMTGHNTAKARLQMDIVERMFTGENMYGCYKQSTSLQNSYMFFSFQLELMLSHLMVFHVFLILLLTDLSYHVFWLK